MSSCSTRSTGARAGTGSWTLVGLAVCSGCLYGPPAGQPEQPPIRYDLVLVGASLPAVDPSGGGCSTWDCEEGARSAPDACIVVDSRAVERYQLTTTTIADTLSPRWDQVIAANRTVAELTQPFWFHVIDEDDLGEDDSIAYFMLRLSSGQVTPGRITLTMPVGRDTATLILEIR